MITDGELQESQVTREMPKYKSIEEIWALQIKEIVDGFTIGGGDIAAIIPVEEGYAPITVSFGYISKHHPEPGGYFIVHEDGRQSYSPAKSFVKWHTQVR